MPAASHMMAVAVVAVLVAAFAPAATAQALNTNLIRNPGAENGTTYWTGTGSYEERSIPGSSGSRIFYGGYGVSTTYLYQDINLTTRTTEASQRALMVSYSAYLGGYNSQADNSKIRIEFFNRAGQSLSNSSYIGPVTASDRGDATKLLLRSTYQCAVPRTTYILRLHIYFQHLSTTQSNNGYADSISMIGRNYISAGGIFSYVLSSQLSTSVNVVKQRIDVSSQASWIDQKLRGVKVWGSFGGYETYNNSASMEAVFMSSTGAITGPSATVVPVTTSDRHGATKLINRISAAVAIPRGTRFVEVRIQLDNRYAYADNVGIYLSHTSTPLVIMK